MITLFSKISFFALFIILSEDFNNNSIIDGVNFINPFIQEIE